MSTQHRSKLIWIFIQAFFIFKYLYRYIYIYIAYIYITSQHGSAWHCYIGPFLSIGKMRFSTSRPGKTNTYFVTKLGRRNNVGKIYKLNKFGKDRL